MTLWGDDGPVGEGRATVDSTFAAGGRVEQDPATWWASLVAACREAAASVPGLPAVEAVCFSAARQTFVPVTASGDTLGAALVWSDRRAEAEAAALASSLGGADALRRRTGIVPDGSCVAAKVAWLARHEPDRLRAARWLLAPRDLLAWRLTGELCTDPSLASATGLYDTSGGDTSGGDTSGGDTSGGDSSGGDSSGGDSSGGDSSGGDSSGGEHRPTGSDWRLVPELAGEAASMLPPMRPSAAVSGSVRRAVADELGLPAGAAVVIGAGDRACEVAGTGAGPRRPMVSWGTTANVSVPLASRPRAAAGGVVTRGVMGSWLLEGGLSAAGSMLAWLGRLTGTDPGALLELAEYSPPGARGVVVLPWFGGARAPWWCDTARGALVGLALHHEPGDLARAAVESVAWDVTRCLEAARHDAGEPASLALAGGGATVPVWAQVLTAVAGLPALHRRSAEAASAGAALLARFALGRSGDLDRLNPVVHETVPEPTAMARYAELRGTIDAVAHAVVALSPPPAGPEDAP